MCDDLQLKPQRRGPGALMGMEFGAGLALLTLAAGSAMGLAQQPQRSGPSAAGTGNHEDEAQPNDSQRPDPQSTTAHPFDIPAGELTVALDAYQKATGIKVHTHIPADKLAGFYSVGVRGVFTNETALHKLLAETGLAASARDGGSVEISIRNSEHVEVNGEVQSVGLQQFPEPLLDTAQSVNVVPQYILQDQAATSLRDGLRNVPGISIAAGEGGQQGDTLTIRGFNARNDIFLDGIRDQGSYYRDSFNFESVDVLEGPAGVEFGRGSTGGVVNQETKMPGLRPHFGGGVQLGTNFMRRFAGDFNEPIKGLDGAAFRVNAVGDWSNVAERDYTNVRRWGVAPSLAFGLNSHTRGFITYLHEGESDLPDYGLPYDGAYVLAGIKRSNFYGFANGDYFQTSPDIVTGRIEHDFGLNLTVRNALRFANYPRYVNITEPQVNTTPLYFINGTVAPVAGTTTYKLVSGTVSAQCSQTPTVAGNAACYPLNTPLSQIQVLRNQLQAVSTEDMLWDQASAVGHYRIGRIANDFTVIMEGGRERSRPQRLTYAKTYTNAIAPTPFDALPTATLGTKTWVNSTSYGAGFFDVLKLTSWLQASGGVRFDYFNTDYAVPLAVPATHLSRLDKQPSYRAALVAKPKPEGTIYFDWGTSFNPSAESLSLSATNAVQPPQYNETYEVGSKWAFLRERLNMNVSWFQTLKTNVEETDPTNSANVIPVGNQRVRGAQIGGLGRLPQHFDVIFGYAYLSGVAVSSVQNYSPFGSVSAYVTPPGGVQGTTAQTVQIYIPGDPVYGTSTYYRLAVGNPFANVPKNTANLFVTHSLGWRFIGGFGFNQVGARRASSTGPVALPQTSASYTNLSQLPIGFKVLPGYWTFNAMIKRPVTERIAFQANVNNLTNAFFIDQPHPNHLIPGEGINAQFGFNYSF